jgi:hypothetical protein
MRSIDPAVAEVVAAYPPNIRTAVKKLRKLILQTAARTDGVGVITETLKWGEPAYLTNESRSGSTIRIGWKSARPWEYAMYFNCRTNLVDTFRTLFPELAFDGNRALIFQIGAELPEEALRVCITAALTYHKRPRRTASG